jgi:ketosteroid isomerase-like protein
VTNIPADFEETLERQRKALEAFYQGDAEQYIEMCSQRDPISVFGAYGPCETGWDKVTGAFRWVGSRYSNTSNFSFDIVVAEVLGDMAYVVAYERGDMSADGGPVTPVTVRVSNVYRREDGEWKIVHRHGDFTARVRWDDGDR